MKIKHKLFGPNYIETFLTEEERSNSFGYRVCKTLAGGAIAAGLIAIRFINGFAGAIKNWDNLEEFIAEREAKKLENRIIEKNPCEIRKDNINYQIDGNDVPNYLKESYDVNQTK